MAKTARQKLEEFHVRQDAKRRTERHGEGELVLFDGVPVEAKGCFLPDGSRTVATCLTRGDGIPDGERVWSRSVTSGSPLRRRGYLRVVPGVVLEFLDAREADLSASHAGAAKFAADPLGDDLLRSDRLRGLVRGSALFAELLYAALCNTTWTRAADGIEGSASWRRAGRLVATLRGEGDYADWYCAGGEGTVDEAVLAELRVLGWELSLADSVDRQPALKR
ncbi:hypothetical protein [Falsiroseomonas sp. CW058]|uniref:hypothetical protein n=1 Tax=Falsiroseomonas sp. CW058 TaxID=3388664 RepID=UPI003D31A295